eukprot:1181395-Prorocentrum_minimum.AAC.10
MSFASLSGEGSAGLLVVSSSGRRPLQQVRCRAPARSSARQGSEGWGMEGPQLRGLAEFGGTAADVPLGTPATQRGDEFLFEELLLLVVEALLQLVHLRRQLLLVGDLALQPPPPRLVLRGLQRLRQLRALGYIDQQQSAPATVRRTATCTPPVPHLYPTCTQPVSNLYPQQSATTVGRREGQPMGERPRTTPRDGGQQLPGDPHAAHHLQHLQPEQTDLIAPRRHRHVTLINTYQTVAQSGCSTVEAPRKRNGAHTSVSTGGSEALQLTRAD